MQLIKVKGTTWWSTRTNPLLVHAPQRAAYMSHGDTGMIGSAAG